MDALAAFCRLGRRQERKIQRRGNGGRETFCRAQGIADKANKGATRELKGEIQALSYTTENHEGIFFGIYCKDNLK